MIEKIVHVSAGLRHDGGGSAHFGRLCGWAIRRFCAAQRLAFTGLHLPASDDGAALDGYRSFNGSKLRAIAAGLASQLPGGRAALFFDHPGPARVQGLLPASFRVRHAVAILGIDAWREFDRLGRRALASARSVVAISEETARRAQPYLPADCPLRVVWPGIELPVRSGRLDTGLLDRIGSGFVLCVGRLAVAERYKGHDELLAATAQLAAAGSPIRLVIAGEGADRRRLEALASELAIADRTLFTGAVDAATLSELYERAAVFAMPSRLEGFGLVFVEAMAASKPCVALVDTAPAEILVDGVTGRLVRERDAAALAAAIDDLLANPDRARQWGEAGRRRYEAEFTAEAFERRFAPVLADLTGR